MLRIPKYTSAGRLCPALVFVLLIPGMVSARVGDSSSGIKTWIETSLHRVFPNSPTGASSDLNLIAARNQTLSFQACLRNGTAGKLHVECKVEGNSDVKVRVRRVGY